MKKIILEERGYFWWHGEPILEGHYAPDSCVSGVLKIDEDGRIDLELDGCLRQKNGIHTLFSRAEIPNLEIAGILKGSNRHALLAGLSANGGTLSSNGISYERYLATGCLVGDKRFPQRKPLLQCRSLLADLKGFEEWLRLGSIHSKSTRTRISAKHKTPADVSYVVSDGKLTLQYDIRGPYIGSHRGANLNLEEMASFKYSFSKPVSLHDLKIKFGLIEDLMILLTDSDYCLDWPFVYLGKEKKQYKFYFLRSRSSVRAPDWHECCTNFLQIKENFGRIFSAWMEKREIFGPGFYLYLGNRRGMKLYIEHRFVNFVWGLESLHRRKASSTDMPKDLKERIDRILGQVENKKDKAWLSGKLKHAAEPNLGARIFDIFKELPLGLDEKRLRKFASVCAERRNDVSHFGGQRENGRYDEFLKDLNKKSDALSFLYHALLLQEIGVDDEYIKSWVYESFKSYRIKKAFVDVGLLDKSVLNASRKQPFS